MNSWPHVIEEAEQKIHDWLVALGDYSVQEQAQLWDLVLGTHSKSKLYPDGQPNVFVGVLKAPNILIEGIY